MELFWALGNTKKKLNITAFGGGIIGGSKKYFRDSLNHPIPYDKETLTKNTLHNYMVTVNKTIEMSITTYRHNMIPFKFNEKFGKYYVSARGKNPALNEIDFYTTLLAKKRIDIWLEQLENLANIWLIDNEIQSTVLSKIQKAKNKNYYSLTSSIKIK
jgi:hypothetical protein